MSDTKEKLFILVTGSRDWTDKELINGILSEYKNYDVTVIHGGCRGVDKIAGEVSLNFKYNVLVYPADWGKYGKGAGPIRNTEMVKKLVEYKDSRNNCLVLAFHDDLTSSKGTKDCVNRAEKSKLTVRYIKHDVSQL